MSKEFNLERYLSGGVQNIVKGAIRATLRDPKESIFIARYAEYSKIATKLRREASERGEIVPPFLIASITSNCNLHCAGCYSRANHACVDSAPVNQLTDGEWQGIFEEAKEIGVVFILLAGGEPLIRRDVVKAAGNIPQIIFPIFTNGTLIDEEYCKLLNDHRNLIPVFSIEGQKGTTDARRGEGVYDKITKGMELMQKQHLTFGSSVTVTTENMEEVTSDAFITKLKDAGSKVVFFIEFVPVTEEAKNLAPGDAEREKMREQLDRLRTDYPDLIFISFPGDEKTSGGCLAAGRGFFHINSHGGAEPCPFSPYSDINVRDTSLKEAMNSKLFQRLRDGQVLMEDHPGGCVLFEKKELVEELMREE